MLSFWFQNIERGCCFVPVAILLVPSQSFFFLVRNEEFIGVCQLVLMMQSQCVAEFMPDLTLECLLLYARFVKPLKVHGLAAWCTWHLAHSGVISLAVLKGNSNVRRVWVGCFLKVDVSVETPFPCISPQLFFRVLVNLAHEIYFQSLQERTVGIPWYPPPPVIGCQWN